MLSFVHPWILAGLPAVGLPVVIHFLTRARPRRIPYPTFHLLYEAGSGRQALDRLRTFLILSLRTLLVLAAVLVFSRPFLTRAGLAAEPGRAQRAVLVVDASLSMRATVGGVSLFKRATAQAADVLRHLERGSEVAVVFVGARPRSVLPALSTNLPALHEGLAAAEPSREKGDPAAAIALAARLLEGSGTVYIFSDNQRTNWGRVDFAAHPELAFYVRPIGERAVANRGITGIARSPARPVAGESVELTCTVFNAGPQERRERIRLELGDISRETEIALRPFSSAQARFTCTQPHARLLHGSFALSGDALTADDRRWFTLTVGRTLRALVLSDDDADDARSPGFLVATALAPSERASTGLEVTRSAGATADGRSLETADLFVLVPPLQLGGATAEIIARRVQDGAKLICFCDGPAAPPLVDLLRSASEGLIEPPFTLGEVAVAPDANWHRFAAPNLYPDALRLFASADGGELAALGFARYFRTANAPERRDECLLHYAAGTAPTAAGTAPTGASGNGAAGGAVALAISPAGRGRVTWANFPVDARASTLPGNPLFPALLHECIRSMRRAEDAGRNAPGLPWQIDVGSGTGEGDFVALPPDGGEPLPTEVVARGRRVRLALPPVDAPGIYTVTRGDETVGHGVVNVDAKETDTRRLALTTILDPAGSGGGNVAVVDAGGDMVAAGRPTRLWPVLLCVAAAALLGELAVLAAWPRRTGRRAPATPGASR